MSTNPLTIEEAHYLANQYSYLIGKPTHAPETSAIKYVVVAPFPAESRRLFARKVIQQKMSPLKAILDFPEVRTEQYSVLLLAERKATGQRYYYTDLFSYLTLDEAQD